MQFVDFLGDGLADFAHRSRGESAAASYCICPRVCVCTHSVYTYTRGGAPLSSTAARESAHPAQGRGGNTYAQFVLAASRRSDAMVDGCFEPSQGAASGRPAGEIGGLEGSRGGPAAARRRASLAGRSRVVFVGWRGEATAGGTTGGRFSSREEETAHCLDFCSLGLGTGLGTRRRSIAVHARTGSRNSVRGAGVSRGGGWSCCGG